MDSRAFIHSRKSVAAVFEPPTKLRSDHLIKTKPSPPSNLSEEYAKYGVFKPIDIDVLACSFETTLIQEHIADIISYSMELESEQPPLEKINQRLDKTICKEDISSSLDWILNRSIEAQLKMEVAHEARDIFIRFISKASFQKNFLLPVAFCSLFIAIKIHSRQNVPKLKDLLTRFNLDIEPRVITEVEQVILTTLAFSINRPTLYTFLRRFCRVARLSQNQQILARYFCDLAFDDYRFIGTKPSKLMAAIIAAVYFKYNFCFNWSATLTKYTGYVFEDVKQTAELLIDADKALLKKYHRNEIDNYFSYYFKDSHDISKLKQTRDTFDMSLPCGIK